MNTEQLSASRMEVRLFDMKHTFESAQPLTFRADYDAAVNSLLYTSGDQLINVGASGGVDNADIIVVSRDIGYANGEVARRFRLHDDMKKIYKKINTDEHIDAAIKRYRGMRLTLNDPWETTLCFIISQFNNVKRIRLIVRDIVNKYGGEVLNGNGMPVARSFPSSARLMRLSTKELLKCGTGFRAKYIKEAAEFCTNNLDLYRLNPRNYDRLKESLMEINGVGDKVADCIALMGYGNMDAFPIDVHIKRAMERMYFNNRKTKIGKIHEFVEGQWPHMAGYAQQYIFHRERTS